SSVDSHESQPTQVASESSQDYISHRRRRLMNPAKQLFSTVLLLGALLLFASAAVSQTRPPAPPSAQPTNASQSGEDKHETDVDFGSRETDARTNLAIKAEKKAYDEHVARAKEAKQLAADLKAAYDAKQTFGSEDQKKL